MNKTYEIITERICQLLENGVIPWRRTWSSEELPRNLVSKKLYLGMNIFFSYFKETFFTLHRHCDNLASVFSYRLTKSPRANAALPAVVPFYTMIS